MLLRGPLVSPEALAAKISALRGEVPDNVYNKEVIQQWQSRFGGKNLL